MYSNVVVGIDGHHGGPDAAALVAALADDGALISLVAVAPRNHVTGDQFDPFDDACPGARFSGQQRAHRAGVERVDITASSVRAGLEAVALERRADLIVVGTSRRHGIVRMLTGADDRPLMHQTPCAVAVAPANYGRDPEPIARIGVAYTDSPESDVALAQAGLLAAERRAQLQLCHVAVPNASPVDTPEASIPVDDPHIPLALAREHPPCGDRLAIEHVYGSVGDELVAFGDRVDLLVCGSRRNGPLRRISFGSTSDHLARHLRAPLIVAPTIDTTSFERWQRTRASRAPHHQVHEPFAQREDPRLALGRGVALQAARPS